MLKDKQNTNAHTHTSIISIEIKTYADVQILMDVKHKTYAHTPIHPYHVYISMNVWLYVCNIIRNQRFIVIIKIAATITLMLC